MLHIANYNFRNLTRVCYSIYHDVRILLRNNFNRIYFIAFILLFLSLFNQSCNNEPQPCENCDNNEFNRQVVDVYYRFLFNQKGDTILVSRDSITMESTSFIVCNTELLRKLEQTKVIKGNGAIAEPCDLEGDDLIVIEKFELVDYCYPQGEEVIGDFPIWGTWIVNSIHLPDTILYPPCEGNLPSVQFIENSLNNQQFPHSISFNGSSINSYSGNFSIEFEGEILMDSNLIITLAIPNTRAEALFDSFYWEFVQNNMNYIIDNNMLVINSIENNNQLKLHYYATN